MKSRSARVSCEVMRAGRGHTSPCCNGMLELVLALEGRSIGGGRLCGRQRDSLRRGDAFNHVRHDGRASLSLKVEKCHDHLYLGMRMRERDDNGWKTWMMELQANVEPTCRDTCGHGANTRKAEVPFRLKLGAAPQGSLVMQQVPTLGQPRLCRGQVHAKQTTHHNTTTKLRLERATTIQDCGTVHATREYTR